MTRENHILSSLFFVSIRCGDQQNICLRSAGGMPMPHSSMARHGRLSRQLDCRTSRAPSSHSVRHPTGLRSPPNQIPYATRPDSVRRPTRFRTPPDQIPYAARPDSVRRPTGQRTEHTPKEAIVEGINAALEFSNRKKISAIGVRRSIIIHIFAVYNLTLNIQHSTFNI